MTIWKGLTETVKKAQQRRALVRDNKLKQRSVFNRYQWNGTDPHSHANMEHARHVQTQRSPFYSVDYDLKSHIWFCVTSEPAHDTKSSFLLRADLEYVNNNIFAGFTCTEIKIWQVKLHTMWPWAITHAETGSISKLVKEHKVTHKIHTLTDKQTHQGWATSFKNTKNYSMWTDMMGQLDILMTSALTWFINWNNQNMMISVWRAVAQRPTADIIKDKNSLINSYYTAVRGIQLDTVNMHPDIVIADGLRRTSLLSWKPVDHTHIGMLCYGQTSRHRVFVTL